MAVRRRFTPELKARVVLELISGATSLAEACRQYKLKPQTVARWKVEFLEKAPQLFQAREPDEPALKEAITVVAVTWPTYGYRRITAQLKREGWRVNSKRLRRLMGELGFQGKIYRKKRRTTNSDHPFPRYPNLVQGLEVVKPDQVWVGDITYVRLHREFVYLAVLLDLFTRCIRGWHLGRSLSQELTLRALQRALAQRLPEMHHSDQGVQYAATGYVQLLEEAGVRIAS